VRHVPVKPADRWKIGGPGVTREFYRPGVSLHSTRYRPTNGRSPWAVATFIATRLMLQFRANRTAVLSLLWSPLATCAIRLLVYDMGRGLSHLIRPKTT
jgi:hypothetical protein